MKKKNLWKKSIQIASTYVGTVIGAGFASGQEIMRFFSIYGEISFIAILLSTLIFIFAGIKIMELGQQYKTSAFQELIQKIFGRKAAIFIILFLLFAFLSTSVAMLAGAGALFEEQLNIPFRFGVILTGVLTIFCVTYGIRRLLYVNAALVPTLVIFNCMIFIFTLGYHNHKIYSISHVPSTPLELVSTAISYAAFNLILSIGVLGAIGNEIEDKEALVRGGTVGGITLGLLLASSNYCILVHSPKIFDYEVPVVYMVISMGKVFHLFYSFVVWGAIFSTLIADVFTLVEYGKKFSIDPFISAIIVILIGSLFSRIGFSKIIGNLYPVLGLIGCLFLILIITPVNHIFTIKSKRKYKKSRSLRKLPE